MLERPPPSTSKKADKDSAVSAALRCAYQIMQQRIIAQPKDLMGILFFGTEKSKFRESADDDDEDDGNADSGGLTISHGLGYPHCYLFMDLDVPSAEDVRALKSLVEEDEDPDEALVPASSTSSTSDGVAISNVLFCANQVFTTNAPNFGSRRLFIITDNDDPHSGDKTARSAAAVRAKDLYDLGVIIELFPISRGDKKFDLAKFYDDIIYRDPAAEAGTSNRVVSAKPGDGLTLLSSLISNISAKQTPKRSYFSNLTFEIAPGLDISVKGYILLNRQKPARTCYVWLDGEKAQIASGKTTRVDDESARTVDAGEMKKAYKFGGEYVYFSPDELKVLKQWPFPEGWKGKGLRIIGFKPRVLIPPWASVKRSTFIYPSEEDFVGSTRVFSALWQKLQTSAKVAIAWFVPRTNANPLLVAIIPSRGPDGEGDTASEGDAAVKTEPGVKPSTTAKPNPIAQLPAGLWLYPLPFAEDIRRVDDGRPPIRCSEQLTEVMKPIIENLYLPKMAYNPAKYPNPALQWHYKILKAMALEEEVPEEGEDLTLPKYKAIGKRVGASLGDLNELIKEEAVKLQEKRAIKREGEDDEDGGGRPLAKRPKKTVATSGGAGAKKGGGGASISDKELRKAAQEEKLSAMSVAQLKEILSGKGLTTSGRKADLVDRIEQWVDANL